MFCARCGTQIPDDSEFCENCGAPIAGIERDKRKRATETGQAYTAPVAPPPVPAAARPAPRPTGVPLATSPQPMIGIIAIAGAGLAAIGCFLAWVDAFGATINAFDFGYVTNSNGGDGMDGLLILAVAAAAAVLGGLSFKGRYNLANLALIALGVAIAGIAGYNLWKIVDAADSMKYIGIGLYMTIAGGIVTAVAGLLGPRINPS